MNWDWFYALYSIATVVTIISFLWRFAIIPFVILSQIFNPFFQKIVMFFVFLIPQYFIASYTVLIGLLVSDGERSIPIFILGGLFILTNEVILVGKMKSNAQWNLDYNTLDLLDLRMWGLPLTIGYFIYSCFKPHLAFNDITYWIAKVITWIQDIPVVSWIIAIIAFLYTLYVIGVFILMVIQLLGSIVSKKRNEVSPQKEEWIVKE